MTVRQQKRPNLPKAAVNILTKWLEENCTNPYPSESMKKTLMEVTNLTKNQVILNKRFKYIYICFNCYHIYVDLQLVHKQSS